MKIAGNVACITGGASGIGEACARRLAQQGARVVILDRNLDMAQKIANEIGGEAYVTDVTDEASVHAAITKATTTLGTIRICLNCAGIAPAKRMVGKNGPHPLVDFMQTIQINLTGTFNVMRLAAAQMIASEPLADGNRGVIINTASIAAYEGQIGQVAYAASKGGVVAMTLPAARELAQFAIRVMAIAPGLVDTPLFADLPTTARTQLSAHVPYPNRLAQPDEFAQLVMHIIENDMLNGSVIRLDGALRMP